MALPGLLSMASLHVSVKMLTQVLSLLVLVTRMLYLSVEMAFITALFHKQDYYLHLCKVLTLK